MDSVDIIKKLLKESGTSRKELSEKIGMHAPHLSDVLNRKGRYFSPKNIKDIADFFNVSTDEILGTSAEKKHNIKTIPMIGLASCGVPQEYDLNGYDPVPIDESIYDDGMYAVQADGDSMSPKINNRDIVYCNVNRQIDNGNIVHYSLNGESGIKRYKINEKGDTVSLVPVNSEYDIITVRADENVDLKMARVVGSVDMDY